MVPLNGEIVMSKLSNMIILIILTSSFSTLTFAKKEWQDYVKVDVTDRMHGYGYEDQQKQLFKQQLLNWEKNKEAEIKKLENRGVRKSLSNHYVNERIRWAKQIVNSNFTNEDIPPIMQFVDNRLKLIEDLISLDHQKFKKLVDDFDMKVTKDFYSCLCHSTGAGGVGGGVRYTGGKCMATGVLGGTWEVPLANTSKIWSYCSKNYPLENGGNIFQVINDKFEKEKEDKLTKKECKKMLDTMHAVSKVLQPFNEANGLPLYKDAKGKGWMALCVGLTKGEAIFQYGNWYGPGYWGGYKHNTRAGPLGPVDSLDEIAQRHDFGYELADRYGKIYGLKIKLMLRSIADSIAARDAWDLDDDPKKWDNRPQNIEEAKRYRARMITGFTLEKEGYKAASLLAEAYKAKKDMDSIVASPFTSLFSSELLTHYDFKDYSPVPTDIKIFEKQVSSLINGWKKNEAGQDPKWWKKEEIKKIEALRKEEERKGRALERIPFHTKPFK